MLYLADSRVFFDPFLPEGNLPLDTFLTSGGAFVGPSYYAPRSKEEIISLVKAVSRAAKGGGVKRRIRMVGAGHSWSAIAKSDDLHLSLSNFKVWLSSV